jgi:hypothetical protein
LRRRSEEWVDLYAAKFDGKDYPMDPESPMDAVSFKRIDTNTV